METIFPEQQGYAGSFLIGWRAGTSGIERTGAAVLKRTYEISASDGSLTPSGTPLPLFLTDQPDNLVNNGDGGAPVASEEGEYSLWLPASRVGIETLPNPTPLPENLLQVTGDTGGRVEQRIETGIPLGGRTFTLGFTAAAEASTQVREIRLEADGEVICSLDPLLEPEQGDWSATGTWPGGLAATGMSLVLRAASGTRAWYTAVELRESGHPGNLVRNGDFDEPLFDADGDPIHWRPAGPVSIAGIPNAAPPPDNMLQVTGDTGGRVEQHIETTAPLGGRTFALSLIASADASARVREVRLEAGGEAICNLNPLLGPDHGSWSSWTATGSWPAGLTATEMILVLRSATGATVHYSSIQVEERGYVTEWDPYSTPRYESDLVPYKPWADLILLGSTRIDGDYELSVVSAPGAPPTPRLRRESPRTSPPAKALFGWEPRADPDGPRLAESGSWDPLPEEALPATFENSFYNGIRRDSAGDAIGLVEGPGPHLSGDESLILTREGHEVFRLALAGDRPRCRVMVHTEGPDTEDNWQTLALPMHLDTLVMEPDANRCYLVWRGAWPFDGYEEGSYRRLVVEV